MLYYKATAGCGVGFLWGSRCASTPPPLLSSWVVQRCCRPRLRPSPLLRHPLHAHWSHPYALLRRPSPARPPPRIIPAPLSPCATLVLMCSSAQRDRGPKAFVGRSAPAPHRPGVIAAAHPTGFPASSHAALAARPASAPPAVAAMAQRGHGTTRPQAQGQRQAHPRRRCALRALVPSLSAGHAPWLVWLQPRSACVL